MQNIQSMSDTVTLSSYVAVSLFGWLGFCSFTTYIQIITNLLFGKIITSKTGDQPSSDASQHWVFSVTTILKEISRNVWPSWWWCQKFESRWSIATISVVLNCLQSFVCSDVSSGKDLNQLVFISNAWPVEVVNRVPNIAW